ncbi:RDD family protein [Actinomycetota bacterium]
MSTAGMPRKAVGDAQSPSGLPREGRGSVAGLGRRTLAAIVDWLLAQLIAIPVLAYEWGGAGVNGFKPLWVFLAMNLLLVSTLGRTAGHRLLGLEVRSLDPRGLTPLQVLVRTALLGLFVPAIVTDQDRRGLHDRAARTILIRR